MVGRTAIKGLILSCLLAYQIPLFAQIQVSPSHTLTLNMYYNDLDYDSLALINNSTSKITLTWKRISVDTSGGSYFDMCASGNCYFNIPDSGTFPEIKPTEHGWLGLHFWAGAGPGYAKARIYVYEANAPLNGDTLTFVLNAVGANNVQEKELLGKIQVYPIPANDKIQLTSNGVKLIYADLWNAVGEKIRSADPTKPIPVADLAPGHYFLRLYNEKGLIGTKKIVKQ